MRQGKKYKEVLARGVDYKKATAASFKKMSTNGLVHHSRSRSPHSLLTSSATQ